MADDKKSDEVTPEEQALADEWAAALDEAGDADQDDIDAMLATANSSPRMPMEECAPMVTATLASWRATCWSVRE